MHANIIYSFRELKIPNGSKLSTPNEIIKQMKQDVNWVPANLVLCFLALEWHVDGVTITNGVEVTFVKNYCRKLINELHVLCNWDVNYVFLLRAIPDVNLCSRIKESNTIQCILLKKETIAKVSMFYVK